MQQLIHRSRDMAITERLGSTGLLLLLLVVTCLAFNQSWFKQRFNIPQLQTLDDAYLLADEAEGLKQGCETVTIDEPNVQFWKTLSIYCLTPTNNRFTIMLFNLNNRVGISFNKNNSQFTCDELNIAKPFFENFLKPDERGNIYLDVLAISNLKLTSESLTCFLKVFDATGTQTIFLHILTGEMRDTHVRGLRNVTTMSIIRHQNDTHPMSVYDVLPPDVETTHMMFGAMEMTPTRNVLPALHSMVLQMGNITSLRRGTFRNVPNLHNLELPNNNIQYIDVDAFQGLFKLRVLDLSDNSLTMLPDGVFKLSPYIRRLNMNGNYFKELTPGVFAGLSRLQIMEVNYNKDFLVLHNRTFADMRTLVKLELKWSVIRFLPEDIFRNDVHLEELFLTSNLLRELPRSLFSNLQLKSLHLDNNGITKLPVGLFADLIDLNYLTLENNFIQTFDDLQRDFYNLRNLKKLILSGNNIKTLHPALFDFMPLLEELSIRHNGLTISPSHNVFPATDEYLSNQGDNTFEPANKRSYSPFQNLKHLKHLYLNGNNISVICTDWRSSHSLQNLNLADNTVTRLTSEDTHFRSDTAVDLKDNEIECVDFYAYGPNQPSPTFSIPSDPNRSCADL